MCQFWCGRNVTNVLVVVDIFPINILLLFWFIIYLIWFDLIFDFFSLSVDDLAPPKMISKKNDEIFIYFDFAFLVVVTIP